MIKFIITLILCVHTFFCNAQHRYHLFSPVPQEQMRVFSLDRPDITESPITVDAGHFQFEGDVVKWVRHSQDQKNKTIYLWNGLYKLGLTDNWDIHFGYEAYNVYKSEEGKTADQGTGSFTLRLKRNFWGNDGVTKTALGAIPYISFVSGNPFDTEQGMQWGVGFPFSYSLSEKLSIGAQPQIDFIVDESENSTTSFFQTIVLGGTLAGDFDFYTELVVFIGEEGSQYLANGGIIYNVSPNVKIDAATNIGLNQSSPSRIYLGFSFRI